MFDPIFPGIDPFIEDQRWTEFHNLLIASIHNELSRLVVPQYIVLAESYIALNMRPDVSVLRGKPGTEPIERVNDPVDAPTQIITPTITDIDEQQRIEIRDDQGVLVTVVEVLSPANKTRHRDRYLANRDAILSSDVHLVEIDLLRNGKPMEPTVNVYCILVARSQINAPHRGELYEFGLRDRLPVIPVPLKPDDDDVPLDMSALFRKIYVAARYRLQLDYVLQPSLLTKHDLAWVVGLIG
jgi:hypothetical protein